MNISLRTVVTIMLITTVDYCKARECLRANSADSLPRFQNPGRNAPRIEVNPIQVIIKSYKFHCCGKVGGWSAFLEASGGEVYSIKFQIWRPMSSNRFVKIGENSFPLLTFANNPNTNSDIEKIPANSEQLDFQPGDVVGYYLEQEDGGTNVGLKFDSRDFNLEELWYATGNSELQNECLLEVGNAGDLSMSTSLGPIISVSLATTVNGNCPSTFTSTLVCPTSTSSSIFLTTTYTTTIHTGAALEISSTSVSMETLGQISTAFSTSKIPKPTTTNTGIKSTPVSMETMLPTLLGQISTAFSTSRIPKPTTTNTGIKSTPVSMETMLSTLLATREMPTETHTTPLTVFIESSNHPIMTSKNLLATPIALPTLPNQNVNVGLHVGMTVAMLVLALLVTLAVILVCIVMKKRGNIPKGGVNLNTSDQRTSTTIQDRYSTIDLSTDPQTEQNVSYGQVIDTSRQSEIYSYPSNPFIVEYDYPRLSCPDYYVNEGMGGPAVMRMTENKAYTKTRELQHLEPIAEDETYIYTYTHQVSSANAVDK
ncbi:uncharacterized protein LOC135351658 isoform X2 [Halichondria panicea]|uniref:uncharacterized protein LOC135351658 isoform X2 n=1 Tax=Halichondria panicea TaxID=6063 RepID=UPI00312B8544